MSRHVTFFCLLLAANVAVAAAPLPPPPDPAKLHTWELGSQLKLLLSWWPGQYDNHEQVVRQSGGGLSPIVDTPFRRLHTSVESVALPAFGEHVLAVVTNRDDDPAKPQRAELVAVSVDVPARALRVRRFAVADAARLRDAASAARLAPADAKPLGAACDILLRYEGGQFRGTLASASCPAVRGNSEYELIVGARYVWERDQGRDSKSKAIVWEMAPGSDYDWYQQTRALPYTCNVFEDRNGEMAQTRYLTTIHLHDQGGEAQMQWPDGRTLVFTIHERAFTATPDREYPLFRLHEKGNPVPIAYAYAVDRNARFGLNLGWFYIRCFQDSDVPPEERMEKK